MSTLYTFEWPSTANASVFVTGTFDNWSKSTRLVKNKNGHYSRTIEVPKEKIVFKFVVDDVWVTAPNLKTESDSAGIENNVLYPEDLSKFNDELVSTVMSDTLTSSPLSIDVINSPVISPNAKFTQVSNYNNINYKSDTESSAFTNVSIGEISPFVGVGPYASDTNDHQIINKLDLDGYEDNEDDGNGEDNEFDSEGDDLVSSAQATISGVEPSLSQTNNLVNIQEGNRQVRYYTSMSLLSRFTKYFK